MWCAMSWLIFNSPTISSIAPPTLNTPDFPSHLFHLSVSIGPIHIVQPKRAARFKPIRSVRPKRGAKFRPIRTVRTKRGAKFDTLLLNFLCYSYTYWSDTLMSPYSLFILQWISHIHYSRNECQCVVNFSSCSKGSSHLWSGLLSLYFQIGWSATATYV